MPLLFPWLPNRHPALARLRGGEAAEEAGKRWGRGGREGGREIGAGQKTKRGGREKENPQWVKQFCQREHIQLKSLLDGEELELSDQSAGREKRRAGG